MEKIGEKLRNARELRKLTIKEISKETNISIRYLEALEAEEFEKIPGETYLLGFLRIYAEFLRLDGDEIVQGYKGYKIGESATPLEELTKPTRSIAFLSLPNLFGKYRNIFYIAGGIIILVLIVWFFSSIVSDEFDIISEDQVAELKDEYSDNENNSKTESIRNLILTDDKGYALVYQNETVQFLVDNKEVMFLLKEIKDNSVVIEILPGNRFETIEMEKPERITLEDFQREIILTLKGLTENRAKIFVMLGESIGAEEENLQAAGITDNSESVIAQNRKNLRIIFEAEFTRKTYLELYLDGMQKKKGIIPAGVRQKWEANEYIQLKIGNAGGLKAVINGKVHTFGLPGQVANKIITWQKDVKNPIEYHLIIKDW